LRAAAGLIVFRYLLEIHIFQNQSGTLQQQKPHFIAASSARGKETALKNSGCVPLPVMVVHDRVDPGFRNQITWLENLFAFGRALHLNSN
jgi:hypothetical protein